MTVQLVEHFFRHEYGKLVAVLSCRLGWKHTEDVEDAVQAALLAALENWTANGLPNNPSAWLFRVAQNRLRGELRKRTRRLRILEASVHENVRTESEVSFAEVNDDLLQLLFVCCDERIPVESQIVLSLKTLCGFDVREISLRLFTTEANVYKRLGRARKTLRGLPSNWDDLAMRKCSSRLPGVQKVLYLLFTEGYLSSHAEFAIRQELCDEAIRLTTLLGEHEIGNTPETCALLALMHLHKARMSARQDASGGLLLLEEQNRQLWDPCEIREGLKWLSRSAKGEQFSRYHAEAGIAAEHCRAASFEDTRWGEIVECYMLLEQVSDSPIHRLNRAVAVAELSGPEDGLNVLSGLEPPTWLAGSYLWAAVKADLHRRCGDAESARHYRTNALNTAPSVAIADLLRRRLGED